VEYFRQWDNPSFDYPFTQRKTKVDAFRGSLTFDKNEPDYTFLQSQILFQKASACLESPFYTQLFFLADLWDGLKK